jgi:hypothetical protein
VFPNLLLTNFFVFFYYKDKGLIKIPRPFTCDFIGDLTRDSEVRSTRLIEILENFIAYSYKGPHSQDLSIIGLQKKLALKTFYLRHKVLLPLVENMFQTGPGNEMIGIYNIYCDFFNERLTAAEFSAFLSHLIIDVFLRACIFYKSIQPGNDTGISFSLLYRYTQFPMIPGRRKTLFKYLSSVNIGMPTALKWVLDDICGFLCNFDFKQMGFYSTNPLLIDGELLQWDVYFLKPYYDIEESKRVRELLQKAGIFSYEVKSHEDIIGL